jgi:hypothetical protein
MVSRRKVQKVQHLRKDDVETQPGKGVNGGRDSVINRIRGVVTDS